MGNSLHTLAINTTSKHVSVAIFRDQELVCGLDSREKSALQPNEGGRKLAGANDILPEGYVRKRSKGGSKTSRIFPPGASVLLAPMISSLQTESGVKLADVDLIALATGPGSFTSLRVGVVTAKALAYSVNAELIGVNTLEVVAAQSVIFQSETKTDKALRFGDQVHPVINAQRQQLFSGCYVISENWKVEQVCPDSIVDRQSWISALDETDSITGAGLKPIIDDVKAAHPNIKIADESNWECSAEAVGRLALQQYENGKRDDLWTLAPTYFRPSTAEEIRNQNLAN